MTLLFMIFFSVRVTVREP